LCTQLAPDNKSTGWVYLESASNNGNIHRCHYCNIKFKSGVQDSPHAWDHKDKVKAFKFDDDIWDLRNFYEKGRTFTINFDFEPYWYRQAAKNYIHMLVKSRSCASGTIVRFVSSLRKFGNLLQQQNITQAENIDREVIRSYINFQKDFTSQTVNDNLQVLKNFFEWLGLDSKKLIRNRDFSKEAQSDPEWLDVTVRQAIKQHIDKLPAPIACMYLVQEYTAARPGDACLIPFDCLVEDNEQWYVQFFQHKVKRWHRVPANREIRQLIEAQQQWIRQTLGSDYNYLFCHFRNFVSDQYPLFSALRPLLIPPKYRTMVTAIRLLIEKEDIRDSNDQRPHFTSKIIRASKLQEVRAKYGLNAAQLYADHQNRNRTYRHYAPPTQEQLAEVDLPFQELLLNPNNQFLAWQSLPESLLKNPKAHELDMEIAPRLVVYGYCTLDPKTPCPINLYPKCYGCSSFRPSTNKLPLYERQYAGEYERMQRAKEAEAELAYEEAKTTVEAMDKWLPELKDLANDEEA
jgi:integrase